ncbi:MAG TPA: type II toxin-antitoxin system Phd/YefM family antitoxin [Anaerolineae bacterium]|nr:type II toxin-antitoxin system Phd/YefM family antitoxin [Anaerolineae bacterium]
MTKSISATEFRNNLHSFIKDLKYHRILLITRYNEPSGYLVSIPLLEKIISFIDEYEDLKDAADDLNEIKRGIVKTRSWEKNQMGLFNGKKEKDED